MMGGLPSEMPCTEIFGVRVAVLYTFGEDRGTAEGLGPRGFELLCRQRDV